NWKFHYDNAPTSCWRYSARQRCLTLPPTDQTWLHQTFSCFRECRPQRTSVRLHRGGSRGDNKGPQHD
ncbi:hypothetical protein J6590_091540, partial [Homalodisca vitripennis]